MFLIDVKKTGFFECEINERLCCLLRINDYVYKVSNPKGDFITFLSIL